LIRARKSAAISELRTIADTLRIQDSCSVTHPE
jgi:hypothetical protein